MHLGQHQVINDGSVMLFRYFCGKLYTRKTWMHNKSFMRHAHVNIFTQNLIGY